MPEAVQKGDNLVSSNSVTMARQAINNSSIDYIFGEPTFINKTTINGMIMTRALIGMLKTAESDAVVVAFGRALRISKICTMA